MTENMENEQTGNTDHEENDVEERTGPMLYGVEDVPSPISMFLFALQHAVMAIGSSLSIPFIISGLICADDKPEVTSTLLSISMFMIGVSTIIQAIFGVRLGIIQGGSHSFLAPIAAMAAFKYCRPSGDPEHDEEWKIYMREIQGNLALASLTQVIIGVTGFVGILMKFIGPLTIAPTIALIGLSLTGIVIDFCQIHWGIAIFTIAINLLCILYLDKISIPLPSWNRERKCHLIKFPVFQLFPVIISVGVSWLFSYVLTATDTLTSNSTLPAYKARTDSRLDVLERAPWFYWPYPFQFGMPTVSAGGYVAFLAATLSSIIESIGDYYAAARISGAPPPPAHAVNRGIAIEGFGSIWSGLVGSGHGTTSYSANIGAIGITKVASRSVFIASGVMLVVFGVIGKLGAALTLIPDPIIGGTLAITFGVLITVGLSSLQFVDLSSTRNVAIFGVSLILGLMIPQYINNPANDGAIQTGSEDLDQMLKVMLGTAMFVGGFIGCFLDNTVPGTPEERGLTSWLGDKSGAATDPNTSQAMYDIPLITNWLRKIKCCSSVPVSPTFNKTISLRMSNCCRKGQKDNSQALKYTYDNNANSNDLEISVQRL